MSSPLSSAIAASLRPTSLPLAPRPPAKFITPAAAPPIWRRSLWRNHAEFQALLGDNARRHRRIGRRARNLRENSRRQRIPAPRADVPPDQDAEEFELHFPDGISLDVLTTREPGGSGAIARYLSKFGEGIQQVEYRCSDVDCATSLLQLEFGVAPVYPHPRPGADGTRINFFLVAAPSRRAKSDRTLRKLGEDPR